MSPQFIQFRKKLENKFHFDKEVLDGIMEIHNSIYEDFWNLRNHEKRKLSPYNVFVRTLMKSPEIKDLPHKDRMIAIGNKWKSLSDDEKVKYL